MAKKPYVKPKVSKVEVEIDIIRMFTRQGFIDLFWEKYQEAIREDPCASRECVFNELNNKWLKFTGEFRYSDYDSFRRRLNQ